MYNNRRIILFFQCSTVFKCNRFFQFSKSTLSYSVSCLLKNNIVYCAISIEMITLSFITRNSYKICECIFIIE